MRIVLGALAAASLLSASPAAGQAPAPGLAERDVVWARFAEGPELQARIYRPEGAAGALPTVIDVHGGSWSQGDRTGGAHYDRGLAQAGFQVVAIDFRQGPAYKHPAASADVTAAVRWARLNAAAIGADPNTLGLIGSSSGGHLALLAALEPDAPEHKGTPVLGPDGAAAPHDEIDASVSYVVALWPPAEPLARYRYAQREGITGLTAGTLAYFADEDAMADASVPQLALARADGDLPPILVVQPGEDRNVPREITAELVSAWQARNGKVELAFFPGQPHAFGHTPSAATDDMIALTASFIRRRIDAAER